MPSLFKREFADPDEYAASFRASSTEVTLTRARAFRGRVTSLELRRLRIDLVSDNLPRLSRGLTRSDRTAILFRTRPGPSPRWWGRELPWDGFARLDPSAEYYAHSPGATALAAISLPTEDMISAVVAVTGRSPKLRQGDLIFRAPAGTIARLRDLSAAACVAAESPQLLTHAAAVGGLEQSLIDAMAECLGPAEPTMDRAAQFRHEQIVRRLFTILDAHRGEVIHIPSLCAMLGVTERTLRRCCQEQLGIGPKRLLVVRRLHMARRALRQADPGLETVATIAAQFGFWEFGRFAEAYWSAFGELPSRTLREMI